eukprot:1909564-Heterocapsa_arctica.AAC.1
MNRYGHGAPSLAALLNSMWPSVAGVGRFGLPADFGLELAEDHVCLDPNYMIYDPRVCDMPIGVARQLDRPKSPSAIKDANDASHKLTNILRKFNPRIKPINDGGWFRCQDIFNLTNQRKTDFAPFQRNVEYLYNL